MAGSLPHYKLGPASYVAGGPILGGSLVRASNKQDTVAGSGTQDVPTALQGASVVQNDSTAGDGLLGVAMQDANLSQYPEGSYVTAGSWTGNVPGGADTAMDISGLGYEVAVMNNMDVKVRYSAEANFGDLLYAEADGGVAPGGTGTAVGRCTQPGGVLAPANGATFTIARAFIRV